MIYVCTTFRDFSGTKNDEIQYSFLDSLKEQTNQNFKLIVTTFHEKNVEKVITEKFPNNSKIIQTNLEKYRFSLSDVVQNGIDEALLEKNILVVWTTCDVVLQKNFTEVLESINSRDLFGICHPNIFDKKLGSLRKGIDLLFFNAELFREKENYNYIKDYRFYNWGIFEFFLSGVAKKVSNNRKNVILLTQIEKNVNDREIVNENEEYFIDSMNLNYPTLYKFQKNEFQNPIHLADLFYCHTLFDYIISRKNLFLLLRLNISRFILYLPRLSLYLQLYLESDKVWNTPFIKPFYIAIYELKLKIKKLFGKDLNKVFIPKKIKRKISILKNKKVFIWGTGDYSFPIYKYCDWYKISVHGFLDSNDRKQGRTFFGKLIFAPKSVLENNDKDFFIVIATRDYYKEISALCKKAGLIENEDFIIPFEGI